MIKKILIFTIIFISNSVLSQNKKCNTTFLMNKLFEENERNENFFMKLLKKIISGLMRIYINKRI